MSRVRLQIMYCAKMYIYGIFKTTRDFRLCTPRPPNDVAVSAIPPDHGESGHRWGQTVPSHRQCRSSRSWTATETRHHRNPSCWRPSWDRPAGLPRDVIVWLRPARCCLHERHRNWGASSLARCSEICTLYPTCLLTSSRSSPQYDLSVSTFSPDGRVFQTEYAQKAVDNGGYARVVGTQCIYNATISDMRAIPDA